MQTFLIASLCLFGLVCGEEVNAVEISDPDSFTYFTETWREEYNETERALQPKWRLTIDQPQHNGYQVREYVPASWVTSYEPCLGQKNATAVGYLRLYLYMYYAKLDLTYPILNKIEVDSVKINPDAKLHRVYCPNRFSVHFYLPGDNRHNNGLFWNVDTIMTSQEKAPKRRFVKPYDDEFDHDSVDDCNIQAGLFAASLAMDGRRFNPNEYYCAMYKEGKSGNPGFEVWFDEYEPESIVKA